MTQNDLTVEPISPTQLALDPHNPRLHADEEGGSQHDLIKVMIERFKLDELAESVISSGYLTFDPIVAYRENDETVVLEGNRRIATLQLLLEPERAPTRYRAKWEEFSGRISPEVMSTIKEVEVRIVPSRSDMEVRSYIGFRHVTGILQWPALEKASFIAELINAGWTYEKIADRLGSYPKHVERHYVGYRIVQQAIEGEVPGSENLERSFGVLMRALQSPHIRRFIGVDFPGDPQASKEPVPKENLEEFANFVAWTFGANDRERVLKDSRQLTKWGEILSSAEALSYLRRTKSPTFERAWFRSGGERGSLVDSLLAAADHLEESIPLVPIHRNEDDVKAAVERCVRFVDQILRDYPEFRTILCADRTNGN